MAKRSTSHTDGLLVIDKPSGWTSHDVVGRCRRIVGQRRIGHAGTLDPSATGVLLVGLGRATRLMQFVSELRKSYVGEVVLGATTSTLDDEGDVTATFDMASVTLTDVQRVASEFVGDILQVPPMVSALKVDGKRLHELAREGIEVERKPRPVTVYSIGVEATDEAHVFRLSAVVSSGTYVRTLAADIGEALGGGAHLRRLRRTAIGPFSVDGASSLDALEADWRPVLLTPADMVGHLNPMKVDAAMALDLSQGKPLSADQLGVTTEGRFAVLDEAGTLLAVAERRGSQLKPIVVLNSTPNEASS